MQYALVDGSRQEAVKGARGSCPGCGRPVLAKCGEIMVHHWAHQAREACEFEREPMTKWHLDWQKEFPEHMREVVQGPHRADVMTDHWVIEFQHSSISHEDVVARNEHWKKSRGVIWVLNMKGVAKTAMVRRLYQNSATRPVYIAGKERFDEWEVSMYRRRTAVCWHDEFVAFHDPDEDVVYMGLTECNEYKYFNCYRFTRAEFVEQAKLGTWIFDEPVYEKPEPKQPVKQCEFPGGPYYGETFTWRQREVCYLSVEEMYFADSLDEQRLSPKQCAMALTYYMTPVATQKPGSRVKTLAITPAIRHQNRLMYEEELRRARKEVRLGEVLMEDRARF